MAEQDREVEAQHGDKLMNPTGEDQAATNEDSGPDPQPGQQVGDKGKDTAPEDRE